MLETSSSTSLNSNRGTALARKAHFQAIQETCLNEAQVAAMETAATLRGNTYIGGPTDPEQGKAIVGVGALFHKDLSAYEIPKPSDDYMAAEKREMQDRVFQRWRNHSCVCGIVNGWTGTKKGSKDAARTDDILAILQTQFDAMEPGPKLIMEDLNCSLENFPTAMALIKEHGWTNIGNDDHNCQGKPGRTTCYTKEEAKESRIDFILANSMMTPAIVKCYVDEGSDYPTHRPLCIEVLTRMLEVNVKELQKAYHVCQHARTNDRSRVG